MVTVNYVSYTLKHGNKLATISVKLLFTLNTYFNVHTFWASYIKSLQQLKNWIGKTTNEYL